MSIKKNYKIRLMSLWRRNKTVTIKAYNAKIAEEIAKKSYPEYELVIAI